MIHLPKLVDEAAQRERIRLAAISVFARRGLTTTGLTHVARAAGMQRSTLYHYYEDKSALVRDLARSVLEGEEAVFRTALEREGPARERILDICRELLDVLATRSELGRVLVELWTSEPRLVRSMLRRVRTLVAELLREGQKSGEIRSSLNADAASALLVGLLDGLFIQHFLDPAEVVADRSLRRALVDSVERILAPD